MGGKSTQNSSSQALEDITKQIFEETTPVRGEMINQFLDVLLTGGAGSQIPSITRAMESSKRATSQNMAGLDTRLAQEGIAGTPFAEGIRSQTQMQGDLATSQIGPQLAMQLLQLIPGFVTGQGNTVVSGLGTAGGIQAQNAATAMSPWNALIGAATPSFSFSKAF